MLSNSIKKTINLAMLAVCFVAAVVLWLYAGGALAQPGAGRPVGGDASEPVLPRGSAKPVTKVDRNGNVTFQCSEVAGKLTGLCATYAPDGAKKTDQTYVNGKVDGPFKLYWEDGETVKSSCTFTNGVPAGHWYNYFPDGKTMSTHYFFDAAGLKHGPQWDYWPTGIPQVYSVWDHGTPVNTKIYDEVGALVEEWSGWGP